MTAHHNQEIAGLHALAGHLIRRCKQKSTYYFNEAAGAAGITAVQYAVMTVLHAVPDLDQAQVSEYSALDASTTGEVVERLVGRGWCITTRSGRRRLVRLTAEGTRRFEEVKPRVENIQRETLAPLTAREQAQLLRLISKLVGVENVHYRARSKRSRVPW